MKTSTKFILAAVLLFLSAAMAYNFKLQAAFKTGSYKIPFSNYFNLKLPGFKFIRLESATNINLKIVKGPFRVALFSENALSEYVNVNVVNDTLVVKADFKYGFRNDWVDYILFVSCPEIQGISSNANFREDNLGKTDTAVGDFGWKQTVIQGFNLDTLHIVEDYASNIRLIDNIINVLVADVGLSKESGSNLILDTVNKIKLADLKIKNKSTLWLLNNSLNQNIHYTLDPMSHLILNGETLRLLNKK